MRYINRLFTYITYLLPLSVAWKRMICHITFFANCTRQILFCILTLKSVLEVIFTQRHSKVIRYTNMDFRTYPDTNTEVGTSHFAKYRNKNLAIANRSRVSCAHNTSRAFNKPNNPVTLKSRLRVTEGQCKRNHWTDHTRFSSNWVICRWVLSWPWNVG